MPKSSLIHIPAAGSVPVALTCAIPARRIEIIEDGSVAPQGLIVQFPADDFAVNDQYPYSAQPIALKGAGRDGVLGLPQQGSPGASNFRPADTYCQLTSATATPTLVRLLELES